jgi:protoporphyrinogen/coproporphyrinogen III oxidase
VSAQVLILGGGITGLAAALAVQQGLDARPQAVPQSHHAEPGLWGLPPAPVTLLEVAPRWGGKIDTQRSDGYVIEGGPDVFLTTKPRGLGLCTELGLADRIVETRKDQAQTYVVRGGELLPLPGGLTSFLPTRLGPFVATPLLSARAKLRMGLEWLVPPRRDGVEETMEAFFSRRLGREAYQWLVEPTLAGIYAGSGSELSLQATFGQFVESEQTHGSLTRAMLAARRVRAPQGPARGLFASLQGGLGELVETLVRRLETAGCAMGSQRRATRLARLADGRLEVTVEGPEQQVSTWRGSHVILATPAYTSATLVGELAPELARWLARLDYTSTVTISFALPAEAMPRPLDAHGFLVPRVEGRRLLACTWSSSKWHGRAPDGVVLLRAYLGGVGREDDLLGSDEALLGLASEELKRLMGFSAPPLRTWLHRWPKAMPQYRVGHQATVAQIEALAAQQAGVHLAGAAYHGLGIPDCIRDGERAAAAVLSELRGAASA